MRTCATPPTRREDTQHVASLARWTSCIVALTAAIAVRSADAAFQYDETAEGDISDDRFAPTLLTLGGGLNTITGRFGISPVPDMPDLDYLTFTVPDGYLLDQFLVLDANVGGAFSFVGIEAGPMVTIPWDWTSVESPLLGWSHFGSASVGLDLMPELGSAPGAVGFSGPLGPGTYSLWIMELNTSRDFSYSFGLHLTPVPTPSALGFAAVIGTLAAGRRDRSRKR